VGRTPGVLVRRAAASIVALCALAALPALAAVTEKHPDGFLVEQRVTLAGVAPIDAYIRFVQIGSWWDPEHTISGHAENMSLQQFPGGCWCEQLDSGGFVRHMDVLVDDPPRRLRLSGGLGPLQELAVNGVMTVDFSAAGEGSQVRLSYRVGGSTQVGLARLAPAVDGVLAKALARYAGFAAATP